MAKAATKAKRIYNDKMYSRLAISVPTAQKQAIEAHAKARGLSVNGLVNTLLRDDIGISAADWGMEAKPTTGAED